MMHWWSAWRRRAAVLWCRGCRQTSTSSRSSPPSLADSLQAMPPGCSQKVIFLAISTNFLVNVVDSPAAYFGCAQPLQSCDWSRSWQLPNMTKTNSCLCCVFSADVILSCAERCVLRCCPRFNYKTTIILYALGCKAENLSCFWRLCSVGALQLPSGRGHAPYVTGNCACLTDD